MMHGPINIKLSAVHSCRYYCPFCMKLGISGLRIMMFSVCEFRKIRHREARTFLMSVKIQPCAAQLCEIPNLKNALLKSLCCATEYTLCTHVLCYTVRYE